ncbi:MAG: UbiD family decarboxylase [Thermoplasmataceae archaeon]
MNFRTLLESYARVSDDVLIYEDPVSTEFEITAASRLSGDRLVLFKNIKGYPGFSIVSNILGKMERILYFTGSKDAMEFEGKLVSALSDDRPYINNLKLIEDPPFKDNITTGEEVNLYSLPIPHHYSEDGYKLKCGRYITSALCLTRDPSNENVLNLGITRIQVLGRNRFAFDTGSRGHTWKFLRQAAENGEELPITFIIGTSPILYILAASFTTGEYDKARYFCRLDLAAGMTNNLPVPADSEIVIEARASTQETADEGPFAEYTGYMGMDTTGNVGKATCIMRRKDAIYYDIQPSNSPEHVNIFSVPRSTTILNNIRKMIPMASEVKVEWPHYASRFLALGYVDSKISGLAANVGMGIISSDPLWGKLVFVSEGKMPLDLEHFLAAIAEESKNNFNRLHVFRDMFIISSDPASNSQMKSGKLLAVVEPVGVRREFSDNALILRGSSAKCTIGYERDHNSNLSIVIPRDISHTNIEEIGWAIATRVNPQNDLYFEGNRLVITVSNKPPPVPTIPHYVTEGIRGRIKVS